jgi:hypothetical protein
MKRKFVLLAAAAIASASICTTVASAASVSPSKDGGDLIAGTGIAGSDFSVGTSSTGTGETVFLKVRHDIAGGHSAAPLAYDAATNTYTIDSGNSTATRSLLQLDYEFAPEKGFTIDDYSNLFLRIAFDDDPSASDGLTSLDPQFTYSKTSILAGGVGSDGYFLTNNGGQGSASGTGTDNSTWSDQGYKFVVSNSWQPKFISLALANFPNAPGQYEIAFQAVGSRNAVHGDSSKQVVFDSTVQVTANVVPLPKAAYAGLGLIAGIGLLGGLKRRQRHLA